MRVLRRSRHHRVASLTEPDEDLVEAALEQSGGEIVMFALDDLLDVWVDGVGKVLSIRDAVDGLQLVSMVPGPWEAAFGLPGGDGLPVWRAALKPLTRSSAQWQPEPLAGPPTIDHRL